MSANRDRRLALALPVDDDLFFGPPPAMGHGDALGVGALRNGALERASDRPLGGDRRQGWSRERREADLNPQARQACAAALADAGFGQVGIDTYVREIAPELLGVVALRAPVVIADDGAVEVVATCGVRIARLEALYDRFAGEAGLKWFHPDPYRSTYFTGFSEVWEFAPGGDHIAAQRLGRVVGDEAQRLFRSYPTVELALNALVSGALPSRLDYEVVPVALALLGRLDAARDYLDRAALRFAWHEDAEEYRAFGRALMRHLAT